MKETQMDEIIKVQTFCEVKKEGPNEETKPTNEETMLLPLPSLFDFFIWNLLICISKIETDVYM